MSVVHEMPSGEYRSVAPAQEVARHRATDARRRVCHGRAEVPHDEGTRAAHVLSSEARTLCAGFVPARWRGRSRWARGCRSAPRWRRCASAAVPVKGARVRRSALRARRRARCPPAASTAHSPSQRLQGPVVSLHTVPGVTEPGGSGAQRHQTAVSEGRPAPHEAQAAETSSIACTACHRTRQRAADAGAEHPSAPTISPLFAPFG